MKLFPIKTIDYKLLAFVLCMAFSNSYLIGQIDFEILNGGSDICVGDSTLLSIDASVDSVQWSPTTGVSMPNSLATFVSPTQNTTYFATLFSGGVTTNVRFEVDVFSAPVLGNNITVCENAVLDFDLSGLTNPTDYSLTSNSNFGIGEPSTNIFTVSVGTGSIGTFDLIANSVCGQSDTIQVTVINGAATSLVLNATDLTVCPGGEVNLSATSSSGNPAFEWFANGGSISTSNAITENPTITTTYVVNVTAGACAVSSVDSILVTVNNPPSVALPEAINGCENDIIELGNNIAQVGATYSWLPNDNIIDPTVVNAELLVVEDGTYILTASNGCTVQDTVDVILVPNDIDIAEDTLFLCKGESIEINWTTNPPNDDVVWTDIFGVPLANVGNPFVVTPLDVVTFVGTVENNGCTFSDTVTIQVDSLPNFPELELIELDMNPPICEGDTVLLQDNPVFAPNLYPNLTFQWFTGDSTMVPQIPGQLDGFLTADSLLQVLFIGTETQPYNRLNINGACTSISTIDVEVIPILEIDITPRDEVCPGDSFTVFGEPISPDPTNPIDPDDLEEWEWMTSSGTIEPADDPEPLLTVGQSDANITVSAMYMGCPAMGMATIPVLSPPPVTLPIATTICPGGSVNLNSATVGDLNGYTFTWTSTSTNDGLAGEENNPNPIVRPLVETTYTVTLSHPECDDVFQAVTIDVFDALGSLSVPIEDIGCIGQVLTLSIPPDFDGGPNPVYTWTPQSGQSATLQGSTVNVTVQGEVTYVITVSNNCEQNPLTIGQAIIGVTEYDGDFLDLDFTACNSDSTIIGIPPGFDGGDNPRYTWKFLDGSIFMEDTGFFTEAFNADQTFTICVSNDCVENFEIGQAAVMVVDVPAFQIQCDTMGAIFPGQNISLDAVPGDLANTTYAWTSSLGGNFSNPSASSTAYAIPMDPLLFEETITLNVEFNGCPASVTKSLTIEDVIIRLPNIFTPGTTNNSVFRIGVDSKASGEALNVDLNIINLQIYDRWGNKVYDNDNEEQEWDGNIDGQPAPSEVYIYTVTYQFPGADPVTASKDLTLLR